MLHKKEEKWQTLCFIASLILSAIFALGINQLKAEYIYEANQSLYHLQTNANNYEGELAYSVSDDGVSPAIDLSFNFTFYGQTFSQARMATNGCLHFKTSGSYCNDYTPDPLTGQHTYTLYPFWTDLIRDNNSRIKSWGDSSKMIFGWYDLREYNRSNTDNSFEVILWANNTFEYRYGGLNVINHDVLIGEIGSGTSESYTYLYHDECSTGTTNSSSCVNTNWNSTSSNTTLENGGSLYGVGTGNSINCSDPLNNSSCAGYAAAYLTQQCNITQLYSESCPSYWEAYDDQQCSEDSQYAPFCPGYTQEASVAYFVEDDFDYGYQDDMQGGNFSFDDNFGFEEDVFTYIEEFDFESNEEVFVFEYEDVFGGVGFEEPLFDDIDPLPDFNVINDIYDLQLFEEPEFLLSYDETERNDVITIDPSRELIEEFILQETVLVEDFEQINTFIEFETIEELDEWFEEEIREEIAEERTEEAEEELYAEEEVFEEEVVEEIFEEIEEQFAEEERVAEEEREEEILEEEETELIAEERTSRSGITSTMLNVVNQSLRTASYSNTSSNSSSTGYSSGNNNSGNSSNVNSGVANSSVSGGGISTSSSPSMSDQIASANVQTNTILSLSQDTSSMSGGGSQTVSSVSTVITPMPTFDNNPQIVMADVQVNNMQGEIDTAISGVMTSSEADQIADQIVAQNIKNQQEQAENEQEETGKYGDETTLVAFLGYVPGFDVYREATIPQATTWYEPKEIYTNASISDNINAFYGLARTNLNTMQNLINQQPNL
tara:strand:+ start:1030 stop:3360 length:2331 start_codon:yes stop_codon:yes gene_type:complete